MELKISAGEHYNSIEVEAHTSDDPPIDKYNQALIIMLIQGLSSLFPWNVFITAAQYFTTRFCGSPFDNSFESYFSIAYCISQTIGLAASVLYQDKFSLHVKVIWPLTSYAFLFAVTTILVLIPSPPITLFWITLISTGLCGIFGSILSAGLFGLGAIFPSSYTGSLMTGQGLAGLVVSIASTLTILLSQPTWNCSDSNDDNSPGSTSTSSQRLLSVGKGVLDCPKWEIDYGALIYFSFATLMLVVCLISFLILQRLPFTRYYIKHANPNSHSSETTSEHHSQIFDDIQSISCHNLLSKESENQFSVVHDKGGRHTFSPLELSEHPSQLQQDSSTTIPVVTVGHDKNYIFILKVFRKVCIPAVSVMLSFVVTIALFPSIVVQISSISKCKSHQRIHNDLFLPILFFLFNLFDFLGRLTAGRFNNILSQRSLLILAFSRFLFFPLFFLCNISSSSIPTIFVHDSFPFIFMIIFALSNGYLASCCMIVGPSLVEPHEAWLGGTIMSFFLAFGLGIGALSSFLSLWATQSV